MALMALDFGQKKPLIEKGANLTLAVGLMVVLSSVIKNCLNMSCLGWQGSVLGLFETKCFPVGVLLDLYYLRKFWDWGYSKEYRFRSWALFCVIGLLMVIFRAFSWYRLIMHCALGAANIFFMASLSCFCCCFLLLFQLQSEPPRELLDTP